MISQLIRLSSRHIAIQSTEWLLGQTSDAPALAELQAALAVDGKQPLLLYALRGERAMFQQLFENLKQGKTNLEAVTHAQYPNAWVRFWWEFNYQGHRPGDHARAISALTRYVEVARLPLHEQATGLREDNFPGAIRDI